ncbi:hypothetical protein LTR64_000855 [Lithohypha guttulata]|uniref:uncharacterized protein n=1 Tax=Lithohypha guttulata TaxID=1690604 RepID=UPI002DDE75BE|nr:hypothetical protein LTR51_003049 [Lithohypha guttulata]
MAERLSTFLGIPLEIRELIYDIIFTPHTPVQITAAPAREYEYNEGTTFPSDFESWAITPHDLSSQLLRVYWEALQTFAWDLGKDEYRRGMAGLRCIELATWKIRHMQGTSVRWRNVKSYERMIVQAAHDIITKHEHLSVLAEQYYQRRVSYSAGTDAAKHTANNKVRWRFITSVDELTEDEHVVDVEKDLQHLRATQDEATEGGFQLPMIDPF